MLADLRVKTRVPMMIYCDNKATTNIAHNLMHHDRTKHVEIDWHFIKGKTDNG